MVRARGARWEGEREKKGLCHIICGSLAGFAVLWFWLHQPTIWTLLRAVVKITPLVPRALSSFSIIAIFVGIPSGSLCGGDSRGRTGAATPSGLFFLRSFYFAMLLARVASVSVRLRSKEQGTRVSPRQRLLRTLCRSLSESCQMA